MIGVLGAATPALAQAPPSPGSPPPGSPLEITVTAKQLDDARSSIQPSLGAQRYDFTPSVIGNVPQGDQAPLNQVLLRAPGVVQDSFGQIHVRGDHANLQYRLDGVQLPEGMSLFSNALAMQYASKMALITGALPAQYGFRQAGIIDITLKSGRSDPGAEAKMTVGTRDWLQPAFSYGAVMGNWDYFVTGQFLHNNTGIENPAQTFTPIHDNTDQWHALAKVSAIADENTRFSFIAGAAHAGYQIPQRSGVIGVNTVFGNQTTNSAGLDQRQWEDNYFAIATMQKHYQVLDFQLSAFARQSELNYQPDATGDLIFNGISPWANRRSIAVGLQGDGSWKFATNHTLRAGFLLQRERATSLTNAWVLPVDGDGNATTDQPAGIAFGADQIGWTYGIYLQDEWKLSPTLTVNFGARFDAIDANTQENQLSPRVNVVWQPNDVLTAHAGYARYFTPPPLSQVGNGAVAATAGTTAAPTVTQNDAVRPERAHYFDMGFDLQPLDGLKLGFDSYYKISTNLLDEGQFGAPIFLSSFNYAQGEIKGVEFTASYDSGPWSLFGNLSWSDARGTNISSAQFNQDAPTLAFIQQNWIYLDHNQSWTSSVGASYTFGAKTDWATRLTVDLITGNGLRRTNINPNDQQVPPYEVVNLSAEQKIPIAGTRGATLRLDVLNAFDSAYQLRDGTGVGVGAPQFGMRRTFLLTLSQKF